MNVAIAGFGVEGRANLEFFAREFPSAEFWVFDENPRFVLDDFRTIFPELFAKNRLRFGGDFAKFSDADFREKFDLILRSPSVAPRKISRKSLRKNGEISSATNYFFAKCAEKNVPIIGVTGSKGKGTTCSFIAGILREEFAHDNQKMRENIATNSPENLADFREKKVFLVGNIGVPALSKLREITENDVVIYELSSFQLWDIKRSPNVGIFTILEPDHLDVHADFSDYMNAKLNIFRFQNAQDFAIFPADADANFAKNLREIFAGTGAKTATFPDENLRELSRNNLPGEHNIRNAEAAILAARALFPDTTDAEIRAGLTSFSGLDHRLKFVREIGGVKFYDDSIATTPGSVLAAIKSFSEQKIFILGGHEKGGDLAELADEIRENASVKKVFLIGESREKFAKIFRENFSKNGKNSDEIFAKKVEIIDTSLREKAFRETRNSAGNFDEIIQKVFAKSAPGDVVILSPAAASFDMFTSYSDRGERFAESLEKLAKE